MLMEINQPLSNRHSFKKHNRPSSNSKFSHKSLGGSILSLLYSAARPGSGSTHWWTLPTFTASFRVWRQISSDPAVRCPGWVTLVWWAWWSSVSGLTWARGCPGPRPPSPGTCGETWCTTWRTPVRILSSELFRLTFALTDLFDSFLFEFSSLFDLGSFGRN